MVEEQKPILFTLNWTLDQLREGGIEEWIAAYEDYIDTWFFNQVETLVVTAGTREQRLQTGYAILYLVIGFFEPYECFCSGDPSAGSGETFKRGFIRVFSATDPVVPRAVLESVADRMYGDVRCGLFHALHTGTNILLIEDETQGPILVHSTGSGKVDLIWINPWLFFDRTRNAFKDYLGILRDRNHPDFDSARANFAATFSRELGINTAT